MASLKCVGGKCDGQLSVVDDYKYRQGNLIRVQVFPKLGESQLFKAEHVAEITMNYEIYVVDCLKYSGPIGSKYDVNEIWFLRPTNFTTFDAIQFQFLKV